jgi:hypothetical protein
MNSKTFTLKFYKNPISEKAFQGHSFQKWKSQNQLPLKVQKTCKMTKIYEHECLQALHA